MTNESFCDPVFIQDVIKMLHIPYNANDNIMEPLKKAVGEGLSAIDGLDIQRAILPKVEQACQALLDALIIDTKNDHNTKETAKRMAKMYVYEVFAGRYTPMPSLKEFPNVKNVDQIYTLGPVTVRSACSHHMVPIIGQAWVGVLPEKNEHGGRLLGLSKFARLAEWVFARPQIQEEAVEMLCDVIWNAMRPRGLAVTIRAQHMCMIWRGVREHNTSNITSAMRGVIRDDGNARAEYFDLIKGQGF